jgi:chromosome segregation ATPase
MAELMDAYQRTHETMGTLAKNVGKNNETLQTTTLQLSEYSSTINEHHKQIEALSASQDMQKESISSLHESASMLSKVGQMHTERLDLLTARVNDLQEQMQKTHKQIFWYLIAVLVINVGSLIYWLTV